MLQFGITCTCWAPCGFPGPSTGDVWILGKERVGMGYGYEMCNLEPSFFPLLNLHHPSHEWWPALYICWGFFCISSVAPAPFWKRWGFYISSIEAASLWKVSSVDLLGKAARTGHRMSKYFTRCKECIVYHYWNHMGDQEKSFINVMIGDYVAIPKKFTNNIRGQIPEVVKLEVKDNKTYDIQVAKEHNELFFRSGWAKFARAYELEQSDILMFRYSENSCFKVRIFDSSGCEKEFSCVVMNTTPVKGRCGHQMNRGSQNTLCKECAAHHYWYQMDKKFFLVMLDGDFKNGLIIPKRFTNNIGGQISETIIRLKSPDGEIYEIEVTKEHNELLFQSGWAAFANAYELEQGDTLVFGYSGDSHFEVQIFSPNACEKELSCFPVNSIPCVQESSSSHDSHSPGSERKNKSCTICKDCVAYHYWHHMDDQDKCFCKVIVSSDFKNKLTIPKKFATSVRGQISEEVKLEVPNRKVYKVNVAVEQNDLVLGSGWASFASAYDLKLGDFLVFTYTGPSHIKVRIFDPSNCEKECSCVVMDTSRHVQQRSISHDNHMQPPTSKRLPIHCNASSSHIRKTPKTSPTDSPSEKSTQDVDTKEPLNSIGFLKSCLVFPMGCNMTSEQKAEIDSREQEIRSQIPLYITAIDATTVAGGFLVISKDYAIKHHLDKNWTIRLSQLDGRKTWLIALNMKTVGCYALSTGWLDFIRDNRLKEGDICIFEPLKSQRRVTLIFHPLKNSCRSKPPGYVPSSGCPTDGVTETGYVVSRKTELNDQQKRKILEKVRAIQSLDTVFVQIMHTCNVAGNCFVELCSAYAKKYLRGGYQPISLLHPNNSHTWDAEIEVMKNRHKLVRGWRQFVDDNNLKLNDICLFELMEKGEKHRMTVHIIRDRECR
ncbi:hypothetical protein ACP70R_032416 [Stipagrostis hirtigluma subsp. patula]